MSLEHLKNADICILDGPENQNKNLKVLGVTTDILFSLFCLLLYDKKGFKCYCSEERMDDSLEGGFEFDFGKKEGGSNQNEKTNIEKIGQEQIHGLLFGDQLSWQAIIYELINTEQLNPWDIDLVILSNKFLERVKELEEANFFVSSKVLFAASLLLRIKSEILLNNYLPSLDEILFGKNYEKKYAQEKLEFDEEIPELVPRSPLPRFKKVTLQELMAALGKAITTENRRIKKIVTAKQQEIETAIALPKRQINIKERIHEVYSNLKEIFEESEDKVAFSDLSKKNGNDKIGTFVPLLHLDYQHKVLLEQDKHLEEIWIWLKKFYDEKNKEELEKSKKEVEIALAEEIKDEIIEEEIEDILEKESERDDEEE